MNQLIRYIGTVPCVPLGSYGHCRHSPTLEIDGERFEPLAGTRFSMRTRRPYSDFGFELTKRYARFLCLPFWRNGSQRTRMPGSLAKPTVGFEPVKFFAETAVAIHLDLPVQSRATISNRIWIDRSVVWPWIFSYEGDVFWIPPNDPGRSALEILADEFFKTMPRFTPKAREFRDSRRSWKADIPPHVSVTPHHFCWRNSL